jgi:hypothetical protein
MKKEECPYSDDMKEIKQDVKTLLKFKWQMSGGWVVLAVFCAAIMSLASLAVSVTK